VDSVLMWTAPVPGVHLISYHRRDWWGFNEVGEFYLQTICCKFLVLVCVDKGRSGGRRWESRSLEFNN
jgi:hypothetical protein